MKKAVTAAMAAVMGWGLTVKAAPTLYPTDAGRLNSLANNTNSNLVADSVDPNIVWVMPPMSATASVGGFHSPEMNLGFCQSLATTAKSVNENQLRRQRLEADIEKAQGTLDQMEAKLVDLRLEAAKYAESKNMQRYDDLYTRIKEIDARMRSLQEKKRDCVQECEQINQDHAESLAEKRVLEKEYNELGKQFARDARVYNQMALKIEAQEANIDRFFDKFQRVRTQISQADASFMAVYREMGALSGGRAHLDYNSGWEENIAALRKSNPNYAFKPIDTADAKVRSSVLSVKGGQGATAILAYEFGSELVNGELNIGSYQPRLSGNIVLSLVGACPVVYPKMFDLGDFAGTDKMKYGLTITYNFPSVFHTKVKFAYNLYKMYERIQESGSSGGFFSSRSWSKVLESEIFRDSFTMDWVETDPNNTMTFEQRTEIAAQVKLELIRRLATMTNPQAMAQLALELPNPPTRGAVVVADGLAKSCAHIYCQAGALALRALDAIFGSSSSMSLYRHTIDQRVEEVWNIEQTRKVPWMTFYTAK